MRVLGVETDSDRYRSVQWVQQAAMLDLYMLSPDPVETAWQPPEAVMDDSHLPEGDFYGTNLSSLICSPRAVSVLSDHFATAGEMLPLPCEGRDLTVVNVTRWLDALDHDHTEWVYAGETGVRMAMRRYAFRPAALEGVGLFKIPEHNGGRIFVTDGGGGAWGDFRARVLAAGLQGLLFKELWDSGKGAQGPVVWPMWKVPHL